MDIYNSINSKKNKSYLDKQYLKMLMIFTAVLSALSYAWSYANGYSLAYNDALSHLNISRAVFDNIEPGFAQLGSVWLPLNHVLYLTLIWNDWAWHSGFAGSIFSMIAYVISVWGIYKIIEIVTENKVAALLGGICFALNLNMLYLQTTPLTESLYLMLFVLSVLYFLKFITKDDPKYLFLLGFLGFLQVLCRYDGWFVVGVEFLLIAYYEAILHKREFKEVVGKLIVFVFPIAFGVGLWLIWNLLIFGNLLYFANGPYSALAQQTTIESRAGLITKRNWNISFWAYWLDTIAVNGRYIIILSFAGLVNFFFQKKIKIDFSKKTLLLLLLISPIVFNIIALYLGFSIINLPELKWNPSGQFSDQWFNTRYGIFALPLIAFFVGIFSSLKEKFITVAVIAIILFQAAVLYNDGIITIVDGTVGTSAFSYNDISQELKRTVQKDDKVLVSFSKPTMFKSELPLKQFIHEGVSRQWSYAILKPEDYAKWIVMSNYDTGDPVYTELVKKQNNRFLNFYKLSYRGDRASIYKLKDESEFFVSRDGNALVTGKDPIIIKGVNSYDLAYKTDEEISDTFLNLKKIGVNTVRFWMFGDGFADGFQPTVGIMNEEIFKKTDLIIATASKYDIRLIPVLVNNWDDYGGKKQYLDWAGKTGNAEDLFYSDEEVKKIFKNYINHVISRENSITHNKYSEETSILAWDIMNEPQINKDNKDVVMSWTKEMADYIKQIDQNHLVFIGTQQTASLTEDDKEVACSISSIDICSVHLYLFDENNNSLIYKDFQRLEQYMAFQANYAAKINKPVVVGEFGVSKNRSPFNEKPLEVMRNMAESTLKDGYDGYLIWNWSVTPDDSFGFSIGGDKDGKYDLSNLKTIIDSDK